MAIKLTDDQVKAFLALIVEKEKRQSELESLQANVSQAANLVATKQAEIAAVDNKIKVLADGISE